MDWKNDFHGSMMTFIKESKVNKGDIFPHLQALEQTLDSITPRTKTDKRNIDIAKLHLQHIKKISKKMNEKIKEAEHLEL